LSAYKGQWKKEIVPYFENVFFRNTNSIELSFYGADTV
jgi:hypothetical protein